MNPRQSGMFYVFTGDGKGKTSAALGVGLRASLNGMTVAMIQWYKDPAWNISEHQVNQVLENFTIYPMGKGFFIKEVNSPDKHRLAAQAALNQAKQLINQVDVLILDEINNALSDKLISLDEVINLINHRDQTHLILTGRNADPQIIQLADLVTSMEKIKHPYDSGQSAIKGLDF